MGSLAFLPYNAALRKNKIVLVKVNLNTRLRDTEWRVCVAYDDLMCRHRDDGPHPEAPERIVRIYERIKVSCTVVLSKTIGCLCL